MDRPTPPRDRWTAGPRGDAPSPDPRQPSLRSSRTRLGSLRSDARRLDPRGPDLGRFGALRRGPSGQAGSGLRLGSIRINPLALAVAVAMVFSIFYISWAVFRVRDVSQIPMLSTGFLVMGLALGVVAVSAGVGMWRAASRARTGRAMALAIVGGLAGFGAIGCITLTVLFALVWSS